MADPVAADRPDIRLIAVDLDGTLLDETGNFPPGLWDVLEQLHARGVVVAPASGRQYARLAQSFGEHSDGMVFVSENGTYVVRDGVELSCTPLARENVHELIWAARGLDEHLPRVSAVLGGKRSAYFEPAGESFRAEIEQYYAQPDLVPDLLGVSDVILKVGIHHRGDAEKVLAPRLAHFKSSLKVVVAAASWVDIMHPDANKGSALRQVQRTLGITPAQTMAFGDYLNDLEMLDAAEWSFAMANAHPEVAAHARYIAPSNAEHGVLKVITDVLGLV